jgi:galactose mutarotase-like enzyme
VFRLTGDAFVAEGRDQRISVRFGPKYPVAIVYAPAGQLFFCFEPMTALTNAFNAPNTPQTRPYSTSRQESGARAFDCN